MHGQTAVGGPPAGPADYGSLALQTRLGGAGRWELFTYGGPPGSRRYFVYTPAGYTIDQRVPMVVMLHGCTQTPAGLSGRNRVESLGRPGKRSLSSIPNRAGATTHCRAGTGSFLCTKYGNQARPVSWRVFPGRC